MSRFPFLSWIFPHYVHMNNILTPFIIVICPPLYTHPFHTHTNIVSLKTSFFTILAPPFEIILIFLHHFKMQPGLAPGLSYNWRNTASGNDEYMQFYINSVHFLTCERRKNDEVGRATWMGTRWKFGRGRGKERHRLLFFFFYDERTHVGRMLEKAGTQLFFDAITNKLSFTFWCRVPPR